MLPQLFRPTVTSLLAVSLGEINLERTVDAANAVAAWVRFSRWRKLHPIQRTSGTKSRNDRVFLYESVIQKEGLDREPIKYLEFGVFRGDSLCWWLKRITDPASRFVGFDTFTGLPERVSGAEPIGAFDANGVVPDVRDPRCTFQVGLFQDTLPDFILRADLSRRLVIHLDADLFTSTLFVLASLSSRLKRNDILLFDNFICSLSEFRAFEDFVSSFRITYKVLDEVGEYTRVCVKIV